MYIDTHIHICTYVHTHIVHNRMQHMWQRWSCRRIRCYQYPTCTHTYTHTCTHNAMQHTWQRWSCGRTRGYQYQTRTHTHTHKHTNKHTHTNIHKHTHTNTHTHTCTHNAMQHTWRRWSCRRTRRCWSSSHDFSCCRLITQGFFGLYVYAGTTISRTILRLSRAILRLSRAILRLSRTILRLSRAILRLSREMGFWQHRHVDLYTAHTHMYTCSQIWAYRSHSRS
jgi:hypothetical protein